MAPAAQRLDLLIASMEKDFLAKQNIATLVEQAGGKEWSAHLSPKLEPQTESSLNSSETSKPLEIFLTKMQTSLQQIQSLSEKLKSYHSLFSAEAQTPNASQFRNEPKSWTPEMHVLWKEYSDFILSTNLQVKTNEENYNAAATQFVEFLQVHRITATETETLKRQVQEKVAMVKRQAKRISRQLHGTKRVLGRRTSTASARSGLLRTIRTDLNEVSEVQKVVKKNYKTFIKELGHAPMLILATNPVLAALIREIETRESDLIEIASRWGVDLQRHKLGTALDRDIESEISIEN